MRVRRVMVVMMSRMTALCSLAVSLARSSGSATSLATVAVKPAIVNQALPSSLVRADACHSEPITLKRAADRNRVRWHGTATCRCQCTIARRLSCHRGTNAGEHATEFVLDARVARWSAGLRLSALYCLRQWRVPSKLAIRIRTDPEEWTLPMQFISVLPHLAVVGRSSLL